MVADLGYSAAFVGLLTGLRYFLAPVGVIAGRYSDTHTIGGFRRLFWIWLGRAMMAISTLMLGYATAELIRRAGLDSAGTAPASIWISLIFSFLLFSLGGAISGSTFLALIYDRAAEDQRGRAVGLVWTFLLLGFTIGGIFFSFMLPRDESAGELAFSADSVSTLFIVTALALTAIWFVSLLGEEKRSPGLSFSTAKTGASLRRDLSPGLAQPPDALLPLLPEHVHGLRLFARHRAGALRRSGLRHGRAYHQPLRRLLGRHGDSRFIRRAGAAAAVSGLQSWQPVPRSAYSFSFSPISSSPAPLSPRSAP